MMHCSVFGTAVACFHVMDMLGSYEMNETFIAPKENLFYTHGNHNKHNHKKHKININKEE